MLVAAITGGRPVAEAAPPNPYKGLRAFDEADAADFFGRADLVDEILARLRRDGLRGRLVLVVGGSGTGKSSVVRAGLLPRVRRGDVPGSERWFVTTMLPGSSPFKELAESLRRVAVVETVRPGRPARRGRGGHRPGAPPARSRGRAAAPGRRPARGAVHPGERAGPARVPRRPDARRLGARQPPAAGGHPARRLLRPAARLPAARGGRERRDGHDRGDVAGRPRGGHRRARRARRGTGRAGTGGRARQRGGRRAGRAAVAAVHAVRAGRAQPRPGASSSPRTASWAASAAPSPRGPSGSTPRSTTDERARGPADVRAARRRRRRGRAHPAARRPHRAVRPRRRPRPSTR